MRKNTNSILIPPSLEYQSISKRQYYSTPETAKMIMTGELNDPSPSALKRIGKRLVGEIDLEYYYIHSDSPLKNFNDNEYKTLLNISPGKECNTFGDIIAFFDGNIDINFENTRKQAGNSKDRAFSEDFSRKYHKSFI